MSELGKIEAVCITLDPQNPNRAQRAFSEIRKLGFKDISFFGGVRGSTLSEHVIINLITPRAYFELKNGRYVHEALSGNGSVGCYLAHTNAWRKCLKDGKPLAIFEDDFVAKPYTKEIMEEALKEAQKRNFDVLRFHHGNNPDYGEILNIVEGTDKILRVIRTVGLCAYIITPKAAKALLADAFPINTQVDHYLDMGCFYNRLKSYTTVQDLFDDPHEKSEIGHNSVKMYQDGFNRNTYRRHQKYIWVIAVLVAVVAVLLLFRR